MSVPPRPAPPRLTPSRPTPLYRALSCLLAPALHAHTLLRAARDGGRRYRHERLGRCPPRPQGAPASRWIHAASVGEVMTVLPLAEAVLAADTRTATDTLLITTNTPTGAAVLARRAPSGVRHAYLPLDRPGTTRRFLQRERPASGWVVETEIWPWLYARCHEHGVPLCIINARVSPRTLRHTHGALATTYRHALTDVDVLARSATDAAGFLALGATPARTRVVGDLKLAASGQPAPARPLASRYVLAASTHEDEEQRLADAWRASGTPALLVIVPRHPERGATLARRLHCRRRGAGESPAPGDRLYLADTLGELDAWYAHADGVFVGGSLVPRGGHNVLEPARRGCPVVTGPHTGNFAAAMDRLRAVDGIIERDDATAVITVLREASCEASVRHATTAAGDPDGPLARRARRAMRAAQDTDILNAYVDLLIGDRD